MKLHASLTIEPDSCPRMLSVQSTSPKHLINFVWKLIYRAHLPKPEQVKYISFFLNG